MTREQREASLGKAYFKLLNSSLLEEKSRRLLDYHRDPTCTYFQTLHRSGFEKPKEWLAQFGLHGLVTFYMNKELLSFNPCRQGSWNAYEFQVSADLLYRMNKISKATLNTVQVALWKHLQSFSQRRLQDEYPALFKQLDAGLQKFRDFIVLHFQTHERFLQCILDAFAKCDSFMAMVVFMHRYKIVLEKIVAENLCKESESLYIIERSVDLAQTMICNDVTCVMRGLITHIAANDHVGFHDRLKMNPAFYSDEKHADFCRCISSDLFQCPMTVEDLQSIDFSHKIMKLRWILQKMH